MRRKKLLVLTSTFPRWLGDCEPPFVFELCRRLSKDFDIYVLAPHAQGAKIRETMDGLMVIRFRYFFEWGETLAYRGGILANIRGNFLNYLLIPLFFIFQLTALLRLLLRENFDVVHTHWLIPQGLIAVLANWLIREPPALLCTIHGSDLYGLGGIFFSLLKRLVIEQSDATTVVSEAMRNYALELGAMTEKISVISMGVDTENTFIPAKHQLRQNNQLLFVGRLTAQKGLELFLNIMPDLVAKYPDIILSVVGQGKQEKALRKLCETLDIKHNVQFVGALANKKLADYYQRATILVFPSTSLEGLGLVCVEALACECPVIASDQPAIREIIVDGKTGLLFKQGEENDLKHKILFMLANPTLRQEMGLAGRHFVSQRFDWQIVTQRYCNLINNIAK